MIKQILSSCHCVIFIYEFGHSHFKQRFQKRRMAELVICDSNNPMIRSSEVRIQRRSL